MECQILWQHLDEHVIKMVEGHNSSFCSLYHPGAASLYVQNKVHVVDRVPEKPKKTIGSSAKRN
jgi:hypothetical protein